MRCWRQLHLQVHQTYGQVSPSTHHGLEQPPPGDAGVHQEPSEFMLLNRSQVWQKLAQQVSQTGRQLQQVQAWRREDREFIDFTQLCLGVRPAVALTVQLWEEVFGEHCGPDHVGWRERLACSEHGDVIHELLMKAKSLVTELSPLEVTTEQLDTVIPLKTQKT